MKNKYIIFVFAQLKSSQVNYKIIPLSNSPWVERVYVLRKTPLSIENKKVECISLPKFFRIRIFYWLFTSLYGAWLIRKKGADLILSYNIFPHGFNAWLASVLTLRPFIFAEINEETYFYYRNPFFKRIIRQILGHASLIIVPGAKTELRWRNLGYNKLVKLHSTIDTEVFKAKGKNKKYDFLFIGEFDDNKRPDLLLNSFITLRQSGIDPSMCLIGFGKLEKKLEESILNNNLDKNVAIVKTNNVLEYFSNSKILVLASLSEGIPCVMLEAMSCELLVLVPPVGDISDVVKQGVNGFLHNNTKDDIVKWMIETYNNYDYLEPIRKRARETIIREHSYQFATSRWNVVLSNLGSH